MSSVLIVGAGIAGPTLAWFLAKTGAHLTIIEKCPDLPPAGQNIDIEADAVAIIKKMGLLDEIRRFNSTEKGTQFIDPNGKPFATFPVKEGKLSPTSELEILRKDLVDVLYQATSSHEHIHYKFGVSVATIVSNDSDVVKVKFNNGEEQEFDAVVAADGQWSTVRKLCFAQESVKVVDFNMYAAYCTIPRIASDNDRWNVYVALNSKGFHLRPDPHGTIRAMATCIPIGDGRKQAWRNVSRSDPDAQKELLRKEFADIGWQAQRMLDAMEGASDFHFQAVQQIKMSEWWKGRVVCVGDAAYAPTFLTGMGTSLAIIGAYVLAGELSKLAPKEHPSSAFQAYQKVFQPYTEKVQKLPPFVPGIAHPRTAWNRRLLHACLSVTSKVIANFSLPNKLGQAEKNAFRLPEFEGFGSAEPT